MMWLSFLAMGAVFLGLHLLTGSDVSAETADLAGKIGILSLILIFTFYFVGFSLVVNEKGYPGVMNLLVLTGLIGLIVIVALPRKPRAEGMSGVDDSKPA